MTSTAAAANQLMLTEVPLKSGYPSYSVTN